MKIKIFGLTLKQLISILLKRKGRNQFLWSLPEASKILDVGCGNNGPKIAKSIVKKSYKPFLLWFIGGLLEPISKITKRVGSETWAFYGFEAIIIAEKI